MIPSLNIDSYAAVLWSVSISPALNYLFSPVGIPLVLRLLCQASHHSDVSEFPQSKKKQKNKTEHTV